MMLFARVLAPLTTALLLSGCVVGPDHTPPEMALPGKFAEAKAASNGDVAKNAWWTAFGDSRLNGYVQTGLNQNIDVQTALERIKSAEASVVIAGAGMLPSLDYSASNTTTGTDSAPPANHLRQSVTSETLQASLFLDFFGLYRRSKESALANLDAAKASSDAARLTLLSQVVSSYIDVRYYQELIAISRGNLGSRRETLNLTKLQLDAGAASRLDVVQSEGLVNSTLAQLPGLETNFRGAAHRVATLLALPAASLVPELQGNARQPVPRFSTKAGIPADLIRNRPDIRAAERQLASAVAEIGVAEAQLYPSITLGGSITPRYTATIGSLDTRALTWSFGPQLNLPILDGGRLRGNVKIAESSAKQAYLAWRKAVLGAVEEVENALSAVSRDGRSVAANQATVKSYQEALQLATASYRDGASSLLDVLDAQRQVSNAQTSLASAVRQMAQDYVSLNVAVGGGYAFGNVPSVIVAKK